MANKKLNNHNPKHRNPQDQPPTIPRPQSSMEDPEEKLQNLKSLNTVLLKETIERRKQVESLLQAKEVLEIQLGRTGAEKTDLENELSRESDDRISLEIEKGLFCVFIETRVDALGVIGESLQREKGDKENEIGFLKSEINGLKVNLEGERKNLRWVSQQNDLLMMEVEDRREEAGRLRDKVIEIEKKETGAEEKIRKVNEQYTQLIMQNEEKEKQINEVKNLRDLAEKEVAVKVKEIEFLNRNVELIVEEKNEIEKENAEQKIKLKELEKGISEFSEIISSLQKEEGILREQLLELEKSYGEATNKNKIMAMEIDALVEEKKANERTIERLMEETDSSEKLIKNLNTEIKDKDGLVENLLREMKEIEDMKASKESEIVKLHEELAGLRDALVSMQESIKNQEDQTKHLAYEVSHYKGAFEQVKLERDIAQRVLDKEKKNGISLMTRFPVMEKKMEETAEELARMENWCENLSEEKREMDSQVGLLRKEKDSVQNNLFEAQREMDDLRRKMESVGSNSIRALVMVKKTAALLCESENGKEVVSAIEKKVDDEIESYATELEVIKNAFRSKETVVEEMKQQVKSLQISVAEANKQKGLWALVSSATSFLFAASVAYVAKLR